MVDCTEKPILTPSIDDVGLSLYKHLSTDAVLLAFLQCAEPGGETITAIHRNHVPQYETDEHGYSCGELRPWVWFQLRGVIDSECISCVTTRGDRYQFDLEIVSQDMELTFAIQRALSARLLEKWGKRQIGDIIVDDISIEDQTDDYAPFSYNAMDDGLHTRNLDISISPNWRLTDGL